MSCIKRALEELQAKGWKINNASLEKLLELKKKENGTNNRNKEKRKDTTNLPG
jgi:hypothetical protein